MSETGTASKGNDGGAPALEEDVDDKDDQGEGFKQSEDDVLHSSGDGAGGVQADLVIEILRETRLELGDTRTDVLAAA